MKSMRALFLRLAAIFGKRRHEEEFAAEMESNLQMHIEDNMRAGMSPDEARRQALLRFGGANTARDSYQRQSGLPFLETLWQDLRYAARTLRKTPGFTLVAVLTLALGIGANSAIYSVIDAVLLKPLPFPDQEQLVQLWETEASPGNYPFTGPDYMDWQAQTRTLQGMSAFSNPQIINGSMGNESQSVVMVRLQANFFSLVGVQPMLGRTFAANENEPGQDHVVILTYGFWKKFFAGDRGVLNQTLDLNGEKYTVVGVMPAWLKLPSRAEIFVPMDMSKKGMGERGSHWFRALGRLKRGETPTSAQAELSTIAANLAKLYPESNDKVGAVVVSLREQITQSSRTELLVLLGAVALVLLVACFNVANLLLARASGRLKEIALRVVLGASRWRIIRQLLTESVLLSLAGAALGLAGAWWCLRAITSAEVLSLPRTNPIEINWSVLLFTVSVSVAVGIIFGLAPTLRASRPDVGEELKANSLAVAAPGGWHRWLRDGLVVGEIAISLALLTAAGLLLRTFVKMRAADTGVDPRNVMTTSVLLPEASYKNLAAQRAFFDGLIARLNHTPGIVAAGLATELPLEGGSNGYIKVDGDTDPSHENLLVEENYVSPGYFAAFGIPVLAGRGFNEQDMEQAAETTQKIDELRKQNPEMKKLPAGFSYNVVISRSMAHIFWPNQDALGKTYRSGGGGTVVNHVIGVVGDVSVGAVRDHSRPEAYRPFPESLGDSYVSARIVMKSATAAAATLPAARNHLRQMDRSLALFKPRTMQEVIDTSMQDTSIQAWLLGSFAGLALLLAAVGLYSVLAYLVTQRTREIGIRMALGAQHRDILRLVVGHGGKLTAAGLLLGVIAALLLTRLVGSLLFGVTTKDPLTFAGVVAVMTLVALAACYVPAYRAMRVEPTEALRDE